MRFRSKDADLEYGVLRLLADLTASFIKNLSASFATCPEVLNTIGVQDPYSTDITLSLYSLSSSFHEGHTSA